MKLQPLPTQLRPSGALLKYYALSSLLAGPFFFVPLTFLFLRYRTLRYRIDEEGISMRWGALFRREVSLNYGRIQDIHLSSNVLERWLGLARIQVQTASASASAEMTIEGLPEPYEVRDFLYSKMRGITDPGGPSEDALIPGPAPSSSAGGQQAAGDELTRLLREVTAEVRALRLELAGGEPGPDRA
jgi:membrane protein YdbS with pleckstrin-like domain